MNNDSASFIVKGDVFMNWTEKSAPDYFGDDRDNAALILEFSNACPFKYTTNAFACAYCPYKSPDFGPVKTHSIEHKLRSTALHNMHRLSVCKADVTELKCELCQARMTDIQTLFEHLIETHNKPLNRKFKPGIVPYLLQDGFACTDCGLTFDRFHNLNTHMNDHYPNFICSVCGQSYTCEQRLRAHVLYTHNKSSKLYHCSKCEERFITNHKRRRHMIMAHDMLPHRCPHCSKTFETYSIKVAHLNEIHGKKIEYPCSMCAKVFNSSTSRAIHMRSIHLKNKQIACSVCGGMFNNTYQLNNHMVKHSGEKKFQCQLCKKTFAWAKSLKLHLRIHNDDKRFVCVQCGKAFVQKCSLNRHMKSVHPGAEFGAQPCIDGRDVALQTKSVSRRKINSQ